VTKKNMHPGQDRFTSRKSKCRFLRSRFGQRRISLGLKQTMRPWNLRREVPGRRTVEGESRTRPSFRLFLGLDGGRRRHGPSSDLDWSFRQQVIDNFRRATWSRPWCSTVDVEKERISLGVKQLEGDPFAERATSRRARS